MQTETKNQVLQRLKSLIETNSEALLAANARDLAQCNPDDAALYDRLKLDEGKIRGMATAVEEVMALPDPEGKRLYQHTRADGLRIENRQVPFGTILIIYESRPDVTVEAAVTAFKAGNRILLKGGKEARNSNRLLVDLWQQALEENGVDADFVQYLELNREQTRAMIETGQPHFDLVIPRGGDRLIDFVKKHSLAPVLVSGRGNNFLYVHAAADAQMATAIALNGKQRLSVCNALDKVLVDEHWPDLPEKLAALTKRLQQAGLRVYGDERVRALVPAALLVPNESFWDEEFLSENILLGLVSGLDEAVARINRHSGGHSASIVTADKAAAEAFQQAVDCAAVYHNASTRFTDGGQFGLGAEIAISTQKLHFRGPLGLSELVTNKWFIQGDGHVRD